jgi:hypothetical protein
MESVMTENIGSTNEQTMFLDERLPLVVESEAVIAEHAPAALRVLARFGAMDLAAALGVGEPA